MKPDYEESIENEDNIASDELLYMEEMEQARIIEQAALAEIELEMAAYPEPDADVPEEEATEAASRTMLKRELRAQALLRLEDGARTEEDFKEVIKQWDHLDDNRERKERYHEIGREMNRLTEDAPKNPVVIPYPIHHTYWRQMIKGDFLCMSGIFSLYFSINSCSVVHRGISNSCRSKSTAITFLVI